MAVLWLGCSGTGVLEATRGATTIKPNLEYRADNLVSGSSAADPTHPSDLNIPLHV